LSELDLSRDDGSTACAAILVGDQLYVANVGDSRAVISKEGKGIDCRCEQYIILSTVYR
jgi:protein phosphatase 1L